MKGKELCETLKQIRKKIAEANGIPYEPHDCTHQGDCPGTCPLCDKELLYLQEQIRLLEDEGKEVNVDVLSADEKEILFANVHFNGKDNPSDEDEYTEMGMIVAPEMGDIAATDMDEDEETVLMGDPVPPEHILAGIPVLPEDEERIMREFDEKTKKKKK